MSFFKQIAEYLYLRKKTETVQNEHSWLKYMHGMNRISLLMGIIALIIVIVKLIRR
jgi:uncharacterized membrane protein YkgB